MRAKRKVLPQLVGDSRRLLQVLINLVRNAIKFTSNGAITIQTLYDTKGQRLVVHVRDTGAGIPKSDIPLLFSKFGTLHRTA